MDPRAPRGAGAGGRAPPARSGLTERAPALRIGASFSPRRAASRGLRWRPAFQRVLGLPLDPLRLSANWEDVDGGGYGALDWLLEEAAGAGRRVLLTVGMKAPGWPEFFIPERLRPAARAGSDVAAASAALRAGALAFLAATVTRYRGRPEVAAWQVENEPLNRSGPSRWWIGPEFLAEEIGAVRGQDGTRPLVLSVFCRFNRWLDAVSSRHGVHLAPLLAALGVRPEAETLAMLGPGDVLGLDVYRRIAFLTRGRVRLEPARAWQANARRWLGRAERKGRLAWVTEAQAEPWEPASAAGQPSLGPLTCGPADLALIVEGLEAAGHTTILLWGAEHWLAREDAGDRTWVDAVRSLAARRRQPGA